MIVLQGYKFIQKIIGLGPLGALVNITVRFTFLAVFISFILATSIYFVLNIHDEVYKAMTTLPAIFSMIPIGVSYLHLLIGRERFRSLLDELNGVTNESAKRKLILSYFETTSVDWFHLIFT